MKNLTLKNIAEVCGGKYFGDAGLLEQEISAVTTDSRTVTKNCLFAAIAGERVDGHDFIGAAFEHGALCVLAERRTVTDRPVIVVQSVLNALQALAGFYREQFDIPMIGITGSVGKTTAKEMVSAVLSQKYCVHKTAGNFNNELGVPLTIFGLREEHTAAVIEMGISHFGEMRRLTAMVQPTNALFTVIGYAHLEFLENRMGVLLAKSEILECTSQFGTVFYNGDDDMLQTLRCTQRQISFGMSEYCDVRAENIRVLENGSTACDILSGNHRIPVEIPAYGDHMVYAALEGAAVGLEYGLSDEEIAQGIASFSNVGRRSSLLHTGRFTVVDDCYNANPTSVSAAICSLGKLPGRRVCILGDMLELGENSTQLHREMGQLAKEQGAALVLTCGELSRETAAGAEEIGLHFPNREALIEALPMYLNDGDVILVKASHSMRFEEITQRLEQM